ncbi:uncharacterized protein M421DRAFT_49574, partial [Didymella exigua CBS 183.55]
VPRSTLQERINGRQPNAIAHSNQQWLTPEQERFLVPHFIACNPRVASIVSRTTGSARATAASQDTIQAFLELFERTRIELGIHYEDIWSMDETGVALGVCTNAQVLASSTKKKAYI